MTRIAGSVVCAALAFAGTCAFAAPHARDQEGDAVRSAYAKQTLEDFKHNVKAFLVRYRKLESSLPRCPKRGTPEQVNEHNRALGALIQTSRAGAKSGEFFTPVLQNEMKSTLATVLAGRDGSNMKGSIMDENPGVPNLAVNDRYPDEVPVSSIPAPVLKALPKLEDELEYRFVGKRLYLMDAHGHIVIDFTEDVLP